MITNHAELRTYLAADLEAYGLPRWRWWLRLTERPAHFQRLLRRSEYWTNVSTTPFGRLAAVWFRLRTKLLGERLGIEIPRNVFGPGLSIAHPGGIVVHHRARVGARCRLHHGVTIGEGRPGHYPIIGDDVFLGPMCMVLGATVGDRVAIRPFTAVTRAVPDDVTVAGSPARIIHDRRPAPWHNPPFRPS